MSPTRPEGHPTFTRRKYLTKAKRDLSSNQRLYALTSLLEKVVGDGILKKRYSQFEKESAKIKTFDELQKALHKDRNPTITNLLQRVVGK